MLKAAKNPFIVAGAGVVLSDAVDECRRLAECLGAPVANSYLHNDSFPASHPLAVGPLGYQGWESAMVLVKEADVILALGTRLNPFSTLPQHGIEYWTGEAKIIQVDSNADMLGLAKPIDIGICGDARAVAGQLLDALDGHSAGDAATQRKHEVATTKSAWLQKLAGWDHEEDDPGSTWNARAHADAPDRMAPRQDRCARSQDGLPPDAMVSTDIGNICAMANSSTSRSNSREASSRRACSATAATPSPRSWASEASAQGPSAAAGRALVGDGALVGDRACVELPEPCDRMSIPVTVVVFRNEQWGAEKKNDILWFDERFVGTELGDPFSYAAVAEAFGLRGVRVETMADLTAAMREACAAQADGVTSPPSWRWWSTRSSAPRSDAMRCRTRRACCRGTRT